MDGADNKNHHAFSVYLMNIHGAREINNDLMGRAKRQEMPMESRTRISGLEEEDDAHLSHPMPPSSPWQVVMDEGSFKEAKMMIVLCITWRSNGERLTNQALTLCWR